jgi:tetratricopeptide (TPR) repeat protein
MTQPYAEKLAELNQIIGQDPDDARAMAQQGETYRLRGRYEEALADFSRAIELNPAYAWALAHRGETYHLLERYEEALADFNRAIEQNPNNAWAIAHRGVTYRRMKRHEEALLDFNRAIELKPNYAWVLLHRANIYVGMKQYETALIDVDRIVMLDPGIILHWQGERGLLLNYMGRYPETIKSCRQALQEDPADYVALYSLAVARACWKGRDEAQADIGQARAVLLSAVNTDRPALVLYRLGGLAALEGQVGQALDYLQEAIPLHSEPVELARHDPAWDDLRADPRFQLLISK